MIGPGPEAWAKKRASEILRGEHILASRPKRSGSSVADLIEVYNKMPKRAGEAAAKTSVCRLRAAVRFALDREADKVKVEELIGKFWLAYCAKRQGREQPDLATPPV